VQDSCHDRHATRHKIGILALPLITMSLAGGQGSLRIPGGRRRAAFCKAWVGTTEPATQAVDILEIVGSSG